MHPAMALWIWSVAMMRAAQSSVYDVNWLASEPQSDKPTAKSQLRSQPIVFVPVNGYLHSEIAMSPLPASLLDRLADLYWTERDSELAI